MASFFFPRRQGKNDAEKSSIFIAIDVVSPIFCGILDSILVESLVPGGIGPDGRFGDARLIHLIYVSSQIVCSVLLGVCVGKGWKNCFKSDFYIGISTVVK